MRRVGHLLKGPHLHYYYWKTNGNDKWSHSKNLTMKEMRHGVERMKMQDWLDAEGETLSWYSAITLP